jgi:hypothetical protein
LIANDREPEVTLERIAQFQTPVMDLRRVETNAANYRAAAGGFLAEIDRMQLEVRQYLGRDPAELAANR